MLVGPLQGAETTTCPPSKPLQPGIQAAVVILVGMGSASSLDSTLMDFLQQWGRLENGVRSLYHLYIGMVSGDGLGWSSVQQEKAYSVGHLAELVHGRRAAMNNVASPQPKPE